MKPKFVEINGTQYIAADNGMPVYIHDDGKEVAFDAPSAHHKISSLNHEAMTHRSAKEEAEKRLKAFEGIEDPAAALNAIEKLRSIDEGQLINAGKVDEIKAAARKSAEEQVAAAARQSAARERELTDSLSKLQSQLVSEVIGGNFSRSDFIAKNMSIPSDMVKAAFGQNFKFEDGRVVAYDSSGNMLYSRTRAGELANFDEALEQMVDAYPHKDAILKPSGAGGSGTTNSQGRGAPPVAKGNIGGNASERTQAISARFPELAGN